MPSETDDLIKNNEGLIVDLARKFYKTNKNAAYEFEDYYQEACLAMLRAHKLHDPAQTKFSTYATCVISNSLKQMTYKNSTVINIPIVSQRLIGQMRYRDSVGQSEHQIKSELNLSDEKFKTLSKGWIREELTEDIAPSGGPRISPLEDMKSILPEEDLDLIEMLMEKCSVKDICATNGWSYAKAKNKIEKVKETIQTKYFDLG
jgi:RNA polymerase sigma factor (sigma-70 family)